MKTYTNIEQSKKLAEILPVESADMYWKNGVSDKYIQCFTPFVGTGTDMDYDYDVPCWLLAALLNILPRETRLLKSGTDDTYHCDCPSKGNVPGNFDNPIDSCYELILKLKEKDLL